jgi:hypothetical protein
MPQSKVTSDDSVMSVLDCVDEGLSEVEYNDMVNKIDDKQESNCRSGTSDSSHTHSQCMV